MTCCRGPGSASGTLRLLSSSRKRRQRPVRLPLRSPAAGESERAIEHLMAAAQEAERGWAKDRAVAFYREALELLPEDDGDRRNDVKRRLAIAHTAAYHARDARLLQLESD